jgi:hypothetical protein
VWFVALHHLRYQRRAEENAPNGDDASNGTVRLKPGADTEIMLLRYDAAPLNLASVPGAVAAAVIEGERGWLCWFSDGECVLAEPRRTMSLVRSEVAVQCCPPGGYEL